MGGAREGKNTSGDYRQDFVSLCRNLCRRISVQQSCDNAQCYVTCRALELRSYITFALTLTLVIIIMEACSKRIEEAIAEASAALGYSQLKPKQAEALQQFLSGKDVFICLPTGSGKTLCFSLLPLAFDVLKGTKSSIVVIVSPLIALMKDQVRKMTEKNMRALYVGECDHSTEVDVCDGKYQMLYFSPELLLTNPVWRDMLQSDVYCRNLVAFVIDEAHCVKKW